MKQTLLATALALGFSLSAASPVFSQAAGTTPAAPATTTNTNDDDGFDLGWLGLLGLAGLAGLAGRKRHTHVDTTNRRV